MPSAKEVPPVGEMVSFPSNGDTCEAYLAVPDSGSGAGVIVVQEWWGLVGHIRDVCDRFAKEGFVALAPDFFHGQQTDEPDEAQRLLMSMEMDRAARDIKGAASFLSARPETEGNGVGTVGFCMGGSLALWSGALDDEVKVAVGFYPALPWDGMSPTWGNYANKSAMIHASEADGTSKADGVQTAVRGIEKAGGDVEVYDYPGSSHAFFNDDRPEAYSKEHSEAAWRRTIDLLRSRL
jgi:carboxymethylenebutenolidase